MEAEFIKFVLVVVPMLIGLALTSRVLSSAFPGIHPKHTTDAAKKV
ncbi:MAG TPA: hypothetical protein VFM35_03735 [Candidatus Binatia bacterium]|nr:hypothetical protein [Candidatus Binatia bacterium]